MNKTIIINTLSIILASIIGCSKSPESKLIGKWECVSFNRNAVTEYHEDGSLTDPDFLSYPEPEKASWSILDNGKLKYEINAGTLTGAVVFAYTLSGNTLLMDFEFERVSSGKGTTENPLIGKWKSITFAGDQHTIEFLKDGSLLTENYFEGHNYVTKGHWEILKNGKMMATGPEGTHPVVFAYSVDGDFMTRHIEFKRID
ncbi:MAG: hypothetical protein JXR23_08590 [Pontiellaceae bacterium]|nr:hypothetical protein [Pontiellaceae bacterium]